MDALLSHVGKALPAPWTPSNQPSRRRRRGELVQLRLHLYRTCLITVAVGPWSASPTIPPSSFAKSRRKPLQSPWPTAGSPRGAVRCAGSDESSVTRQSRRASNAQRLAASALGTGTPTNRAAADATSRAPARLWPPRSASASDDGSSPPTSPSDRGVPSLLRPPLQDVAACHFISNYVLIPRQGFTATRGWLEFVLPLLNLETSVPHFKHAFKACALASLNNRVGTGNDFDKQALGHYTKALAATFAALRDPQMVKQDATLASILLLGIFESITAKSLGMFAWSSHVEGAIELVKTRGPEQLETKIGRDLFAAVRIQMITHSLSTGKASSMGVEWWAHGPISNGHSAEFQQLSGRTGLLRNEVNQLLGTVARTPEHVELMKERIRRCRALDKEVVDWLQELPDICRWKTVAWEDYNPKCDYAKAEAFPGRIDLYRDIFVVNMWNVMRCMRIVLASLIIRLTAWIISPADYRTTPEYAAVSRTCSEAIADIIASVPYQLGWFSRHKHLRVEEQLSGFACGEDNTNKSLAGYFAIWPLVCVQGQDYLTDLQRLWVKGRLKCISSELGVRYADMLSQLNVRMPSMLILRDRLKGSPQNLSGDAGGASPSKHGSTAAVATSPQAGFFPGSPNKQETAYRKVIQDQTEQLKKQAVESKGAVDDWTVKLWLQL